MSEAYFIAGSKLPTGSSLDSVLQSIFVAAEIKPKQVDEMHMFSDAASALFQRRLDTVFGSVIQWPLIPYLPVNGLFSACRALEIGEISTCILAEISNQTCSVLLLANPMGVGRLNLTPQVLLSNRVSYSEGIPDLPATAAKIISSAPKGDPQPEDETPDLRIPPKKAPRPWLAVHSPEKPDVPGWPEDRLIHSSAMLPSLFTLITAMQDSKTDPGVWISSAAIEPACSLLVLPL